MSLLAKKCSNVVGFSDENNLLQCLLLLCLASPLQYNEPWKDFPWNPCCVWVFHGSRFEKNLKDTCVTSIQILGINLLFRSNNSAVHWFLFLKNKNRSDIWYRTDIFSTMLILLPIYSWCLLHYLDGLVRAWAITILWVMYSLTLPTNLTRPVFTNLSLPNNPLL